MKTCTECGRRLKENEDELCPACKSEKDSSTKKAWTITGIIIGVLGVTYKIISKAKTA